MIIGIDARPLLTIPKTGVGEFAYELLSHLFVQDTKNTYLLFANAFTEQDEMPFQEYANVQWVITRVPNKLLHLSIFLCGYPQLDRYVANRAGVQSIDVWFSPNLQFTSCSKYTKHILIVHDLSYYHYPSFFSYKGRIWHRAVRAKKQITHADVIITPSQHTARDVADVYEVEKERIHIVYPGVCSHLQSDQKHTVAEVIQTYNLPETFLLFLGTLEPRKNIDGILDAYRCSSYLKKKIPLIFAGSLGYKGSLYKAMIEQTEGARYIGYVDERDKHGLYARARAFVYPSLYEGFGLPVLEALSCATPVITSHRTSLPEVVGDAGILVNPYSVTELQTRMEDIVHDDMLYSAVQEKAVEQAIRFSWDVAVRRCMELIEHI
ncbi:MAG: hypothetical protein COV60_00210 [Candidatus Magasanikbacteria bacterium CG11_big_fil_rev_8_21_14_0_20_43_7]|uniref:Glycosyl transferase family 1 domain-containing protein n=1 Tax=Candidatus Magasanikbacteria bacterium CG11_big_fil_rev_8_21_14_0_20_43_7 TaxID=1974654 RepID=A0A2H0N3H2_9BACT|nr:MAG: hypothetical protein COV60_00210 [Candidatus Magasanikbacteria bacterium CG11_big_fil_rev_8_21_14_0_20_43_7]